MREIMKVQDAFVVPGLGLVISGTNPELDDLDSNQIKSLIGDFVLIRSPNGKEMQFKMCGVDASASLIGKKNINISLGEGAKLSDIAIDSMVYSKEVAQ